MRLYRSDSPRVNIVCASILVYILAVLYLARTSARDPTSAFFSFRTGYKPIYTSVRRNEATAFVRGLDAKSFTRRPSNDKPLLCLGLPTIAREEEQYLRYAVGSLFAGLTEEERQDILFMPFIAHTDPQIHPAYREHWLDRVADVLFVYDQSDADFAHVKALEDDKDFRKKALLDYIRLLKKCADTGASYVAMIEDDVLARDGWFHRTREALKIISNQKIPLLYLRLFYTEEYLGWNSENWPIYLFWSAVSFVAIELLTLTVRSFSPRLRRTFSETELLLLCGVNWVGYVALFFMAGRMTMLPLKHGVVQMNNYGCCGQGLVYPREAIPGLITWYQDKGVGFVDSLTEEFADEKGLNRWALVPSVLQHIGSKSSKGEDHAFDLRDLSIAERIWNFEFELHEPT